MAESGWIVCPWCDQYGAYYTLDARPPVATLHHDENEGGCGYAWRSDEDDVEEIHPPDPKFGPRQTPKRDGAP